MGIRKLEIKRRDQEGPKFRVLFASKKYLVFALGFCLFGSFLIWSKERQGEKHEGS